MVEWMSGLLLQLKPFVGQLWAALYADRAGGKIWRAQVETALVWLDALFRSSDCLFAVRHLRPAATQAVVASDASPFGGGALLYILPADAPITIQTLERATPWAWMAAPWSKKDEHRAQGWIGDAASQARWEAYASISAVKRWAKPALEARGGLTVVGDALGVLWGESVLRSKDAHINKLFMELALVLAPGGFALECVHVHAEDNQLADVLSRMTADAAPPPGLKGVGRTRWHSEDRWHIV